MSVAAIQRYADLEALSQAAADAFVSIARDAIAVRGRFIVVLSGGSTPQRLYRLLAAPPFNTQVAWDKVEFFWGDERAVLPDHPDSNYHMANEALLKQLGIPATYVHRMSAERENLEAAAGDYQAEIARVFGIGLADEPPAFDLVLLGMGADGHTASLFPYTDALNETNRWVVCNYVPKLDSHRLTLTARIINKALHVMFLVAGADKAEPLAEVLEGQIDPDRLPSQLIRPAADSCLWLVDDSAASRLRLPNPATPSPTKGGEGADGLMAKD